MENKTRTFSQVFLRIGISASFLSAVADRFGLWGKPGSDFVAWGNWENFLNYSNSVNSFMPLKMAELLAISATALEIILPVFLLLGCRLKLVSMISGFLLSAFAVAMTLSFSIKVPLDYSVFTAAAAAFLLSTINYYKYSLDAYLQDKSNFKKNAPVTMH